MEFVAHRLRKYDPDIFEGTRKRADISEGNV